MQASTSFKAVAPTGMSLRRSSAFGSAPVQARFARAELLVRCETKEKSEATPGAIEEMDPLSESALKQQEIDNLRAAEKFMTKGDGDADCGGCGYKYDPKQGDPDFPVPRGMLFSQLPEDYICPICGADKSKFRENVVEIAGFEQNQGYGLGTNAMTEADKSKLIYGSLAFFFALFISGYFLN